MTEPVSAPGTRERRSIRCRRPSCGGRVMYDGDDSWCLLCGRSPESVAEPIPKLGQRTPRHAESRI